MKEKWFALTMVLCLLIAMTGCSAKEKNTHATGGTNTSTESTQSDKKADNAKPLADLPEPYTVVVRDYLKVVLFRLSDSFGKDDSAQMLDSLNQSLAFALSDGGNEAGAVDLKYRWECMIIDMLAYIPQPSISSFGYILKDLDGDESPELIWVSADYNTVFAIFTISDNKAVLVDAYWPRYKAVILDSGGVYTHGSGGASTFEYTCWTLDKGQPDCKKIQKQFGSNDGQYYEVTENASVDISRDRFDALLQEQPFEAGSTWKNNTIHLLTELTDGTTRVLEKTQWYEVTETAWLISYTLFDKDGNAVKTEINLPRQPRIVYKDGLVRVTKQFGTGILVQHGYFYDPQNNVFSQAFNCILDHKNGLVARADWEDNAYKVIIEDIFDNTPFYQEITLVKATSSVDPYRDGEFSEDGKSIHITYYSGVDQADITEEFALQPPAGYLIQESAENVISFPIPHRNSMSAEEMTFIQNYVQNELLTRTGEKIDLTLSSENVKNKDQAYTQYTQYSILMESWVAYESDTHVSIVWRGLFNKKGTAHPTHWLFALNYNPKTLQVIPFAEKYAVNNPLYAIFADLAEKEIKKACAGVLPTGWESFREPIPSEKAFLDGMLAENEFCYYLQNTGVTISYPVAHPIGDHKEVTIPYDQLKKQ